MKITVTMPEDPAQREALLRRAAELHAALVCEALKALPGPVSQKNALLKVLFRAEMEAGSR